MEDPHRIKVKSSGRMRYSLRPRTVFVLSFLLFCLIGLANLIEYLQNRKSLLGLVRRQGYELLDVLIATGTRSILTNEALEDDLWRHLLTAAALFEEMDYRNVPRKEIAALSDRAGVDTVLITGWSDRSQDLGRGKLPASWTALLDSFMNSEDRELFLSDPGFPDDFAVAVKRRKGGAVIAAVQHGRLRNLERRISPGTLVQEIGSRPGIAYVAIQDTLGIYMASRGVTWLSSIRDDSLLSRVYRGSNRDSRFAEFRGERIMEVAGAFGIEEERKGVLRLGLRLDIYEQYLRGLGLRLLLTLLLFGFILIIGISLLVVTRKEQWISESYARSAVRTAMIMDYLQNGVIATDQKGIITLCNPAAERILETQRGRLVGRSVRELEPECFRLISDLFDKGRTVQQEERDCLVNAVQKRLVISTSMVPGREGRLDAAVMVMADVTRERRLEEQVQRQ
ncbi:PAS domain-containing protein, partial [bacterium]|nr:PAS domain-containing protein [bacterium]